MRAFTQEEKELIISTPITREVFDMTNYNIVPVDERMNNEWFWNRLVEKCEFLRSMCKGRCSDIYFIELIRLLPNSYRIVNLCS